VILERNLAFGNVEFRQAQIIVDKALLIIANTARS